MDALDAQVRIADLTNDLTAASRCPGWSVGDVLNHSVGVTAKFAAFAAGVTDEPHAPPGDLLGADHRAAMRRAADAARAAWPGVDRRRLCRLPFGVFPAELAAAVNLVDVLAHAWDVADPAIPLPIPDELWEDGRRWAAVVVGEARDPAHYGRPVDVPAGASPRTRFLGYLGRVDTGERMRS